MDLSQGFCLGPEVVTRGDMGDVAPSISVLTCSCTPSPLHAASAHLNCSILHPTATITPSQMQHPSTPSAASSIPASHSRVPVHGSILFLPQATPQRCRADAVGTGYPAYPQVSLATAHGADTGYPTVMGRGGFWPPGMVMSTDSANLPPSHVSLHTAGKKPALELGFGKGISPSSHLPPANNHCAEEIQ